MPYTVALIPGDGIGPEVTAAAVRVLEATGLPFTWEVAEAGAAALADHGDVLPQSTLDTIVRCRTALKGPIATPVGKGFASVNVGIRRALDLYANVRPVKSLPVAGSRPDVDLVVVRENTEGMYSGVEHIVVPGVAVSLKIVTERASTRIATYAFELARRQGRRRVSAVHKANIMKLTDGLFLESARAVAREYPDIDYEEVIVDAMGMHLVLHPGHADVLVMGNLYGDIMSDMAAGLVGGLGLTPSGNIGDRVAVFEAVHGSAPDIAGQGVANPAALILSAAMLLRHLGEGAMGEAVANAVSAALAGTVKTPDVGGSARTDEFASAVIDALEAVSSGSPGA
jgi:isocitrate dehydrogenase (NAD+)